MIIEQVLLTYTMYSAPPPPLRWQTAGLAWRRGGGAHNLAASKVSSSISLGFRDLAQIEKCLAKSPFVTMTTKK